MVHVTIGGITREYEEGTQLKTAAEEFQGQYENNILLATVNGKLQELHKAVPDDAEIGFLTAADKTGMLTYRRSALLMLLKAFYDVAGRDRVRKLSVEFTVGNGLYIDTEGVRRIHYLLYLYERGSRTDERRELPLYDALSLRKSGAGTYRRSRRTLSGENDCMRRSRRIEEKRLRLPKNILKIVFHQMKK